jgi:hypothetical protein
MICSRPASQHPDPDTRCFLLSLPYLPLPLVVSRPLELPRAAPPPSSVTFRRLSLPLAISRYLSLKLVTAEGDGTASWGVRAGQ